MSLDYLDFERPIADLEAKIAELRKVGTDGRVDIANEINLLQERSCELTKNIFSSISVLQICQLARHPRRPYFLDYLPYIFDEFEELHGDRHFREDAAIVGGLARLNNMPVVVVANQKGRSTKEKLRRNFGMASPEGYRKAHRLMLLADKFKLPLLTFIDTSGAYPGVGAEERGQSEAIARNLLTMADLKVPIISVITGEGCSGGALAIGVCDRLVMLEYSTYSVISPEGCASILWKDRARAKDAAEAMSMTSYRLYNLGLVDEVVPEPLGGAHRNLPEAAYAIKQSLLRHYANLSGLPTDKLLEERYSRYTNIGRHA